MTVYTAILGNYDDLKDPLVVTPGWKYICFTNQDLQSDIWEIIKCPLEGGPRRTSKLYKIMFHSFIEDQYSMWVDASFYINCNLDEFWQRFRGPMTLMQHPTRNCVYDEGLACIRNQRDNPDTIRRQITRYRNLGLPANNGMAASGIMMRERTPETIRFAEIWYRELSNYCMRDQISYAYANWQLPIAHLTNWNYRTQTEFMHVPHLRDEEKRRARLSHYKSLKLL